MLRNVQAASQTEPSEPDIERRSDEAERLPATSV
jgi:hypothetical protein